VTGVAVDQLVVNGSFSNLTTLVALRIQSEIHRSGASEVFAVHADPSATYDLLPLEKLDTTSSERVLLYHAGRADPVGTRALMATHSQLVLLWHSATPQVRDWDRYELQLLRSRTVLAVADSPAGVAVLESAGYSDVELIPIAPAIATGASSLASTWVETLLQMHCIDGPYVLATETSFDVPRNELTVQALALIRSVIGRNVSLVIVSDDATTVRAQRIRELARQLDVQCVWFPASAPSDIDVLLVKAAVAVVTGHAGATSLATQAMLSGVPVVVAVPEACPTDGYEGALALPPNSGPVMLAEVIDLLLRDESMRASNAARGQHAVRAMLNSDSTQQLVQLLMRLVASSTWD